jgi:hypothetical protein
MAHILMEAQLSANLAPQALSVTVKAFILKTVQVLDYAREVPRQTLLVTMEAIILTINVYLVL